LFRQISLWYPKVGSFPLALTFSHPKAKQIVAQSSAAIAQASKTPRKVEEFLPAQKANQQSDQPQGKMQKTKKFSPAGVTLRRKKRLNLQKGHPGKNRVARPGSFFHHRGRPREVVVQSVN
jgi:hypothetical protein